MAAEIESLDQRSRILVMALASAKAELTEVQLRTRLANEGDEVSQPTMSRLLRKLITKRFVKKQGTTRGATYTASRLAKICLRDFRKLTLEVERAEARAAAPKPLAAPAAPLPTPLVPSEPPPVATPLPQRRPDTGMRGYASLYSGHFRSAADRKKADEPHWAYRPHIWPLDKLGRFKPTEEGMARFGRDLAWMASSLVGDQASFFDMDALFMHNTSNPTLSARDEKLARNITDVAELVRLADWKDCKSAHEKLTAIHRALYEGILEEAHLGTRGNVSDWHFEHEIEAIFQEVERISDPFEKGICLLVSISYFEPFALGNSLLARVLTSFFLLYRQKIPMTFLDFDVEQFHKSIREYAETGSPRAAGRLFADCYRETADRYLSVAD